MPACSDANTDESDDDIALASEALTATAVQQLVVPPQTTNCAWDKANGDIAPTNKDASSRVTQQVTMTVPKGTLLQALKLSTPGGLLYDDVIAIHYGPPGASRLIVASDARIAERLGAGDAPLYDWTALVGKKIDNQSAQKAWCSKATGADCVFPPTETTGPLNVDIKDFATIDASVYPDGEEVRTFSVTTIGDNEPRTDCKHNGLNFTVAYKFEKAVVVPVSVSKDCARLKCPPTAPFPVGCDLDFRGEPNTTPDPRGCVANAPGTRKVFVKEGNVCGKGSVTGTLRCSSKASVPLTQNNCRINKRKKFYPALASDCPGGVD